jgi:hypothetical protein
MDEAPSTVDQTLEDIRTRLEAVEERLGRIETGLPLAAASSGLPLRATVRPAADVARAMVPDVGSGITLLGRTFFVLAGAFLLRALTDSGRLGVGVGGILGVVYASIWIVWADRASQRGQRASAVFHGLAFVLIAFPLLFELTVRFGVLTASGAAWAVALSAAIALVVVWRTTLRALAWITAAGVVVTVVGLMFALAEIGPFAFVLVALGVATVWLGYVFGWTVLRWPIALAADVAVLVLSFRAVSPAVVDVPAAAFVAQAALLVSYLGTFATRTLLLNRDVIPFEVAQTAAAALVGLGGAAHVTARIGGGAPLGLTTMALAIGCYAAAAIFIERRQARRRNYYVYTTAGLVFAIAGVVLALPAPIAGVTCAVFGVIAAFAGRLTHHVTYRAHGAVYLVSAAVATGFFWHAAYGLGVPIVPESTLTRSMMIVFAACGLALWGLGHPSGRDLPTGQRAPRLVVMTLAIGGVLATVVGGAGMRQLTSTSPDLLATIRTSLLVAAILGCAIAWRFLAVAEAAWLVYPLLALTGLKFLVEDVAHGRPATLMFSFALYGVALFVGPRLIRGRRPEG